MSLRGSVTTNQNACFISGTEAVRAKVEAIYQIRRHERRVEENSERSVELATLHDSAEMEGFFDFVKGVITVAYQQPSSNQGSHRKM